MSEAIFMEIANEIKAMSNQAARMIKEGKFSEAENYYNKALEITKYVCYYDGMAMIYFNLANMEVLRDDLLQALTYGALALEMHREGQSHSRECVDLVKKLAFTAMKKGLSYEQEGKLQLSLDYFYAAVNFVEEKYQEAIRQEIALIERVIDNGERSTS